MGRKLTATAAGVALSALISFAPTATVFGDEVEDRIKALEDAKQSLDAQIDTLRQEQIELRKEATEAAAKMPTFRYRPGNGLLIEAANKAWSWRTSMEAHIRWNFLAGRDQRGRTMGEVEGRRFRLEHYLCLNNCLWEIELEQDHDGMGGGIENSTGGEVSSSLGRGVVHFHAENLNPWMPTVTAGMDISTTGSATSSRQGSSQTGAQLEYDLLSRNVGPNTGSSGNGVTLTWDNRSLKGIGIPGRITRFQMAMANIGMASDGLSNFTDRKSFSTYLGMEPWRYTKNKWLRGLRLEFGATFCNGDNRAQSRGHCDRFRIRPHGLERSANTLFDTGSGSVGDGTHYWLSPGIMWTVGPYRLRATGGFAHAEDRGGRTDGNRGGRGKKRAHNFLIGHDLYVWSPKGWFTGSANTPGSVLLGYHFERNDISLGCNGSTGIACPAGGLLGQFHRNTIRVNEWDIWYYIDRRMSIGLAVLWYDAKNLRQGYNQAAHNLGVCKNANCRTGAGGDWVDAALTWRYYW